jgi:hypothetical protein
MVSPWGNNNILEALDQDVLLVTQVTRMTNFRHHIGVTLKVNPETVQLITVRMIYSFCILPNVEYLFIL